MTLLFFDSCNQAATYPKPEWFFPSDPWINQAGRDGSANGAASTERGRAYQLILPSAASTCILGTGLYLGNSAFGVTTNMPIQFVRSGTVELIIQVNSSGFLEVRRTSGTGTLLGTTSGHAAWATNSWRHLQVKVNLHTSTGSVEVKIDGVTGLSLSGVQTAVTSGAVTMIQIQSGQAGSGSSNQVRLDDLWVCDGVDASSTQGRPYNDYLGDLKVATLVPDGAGDATFWTPSTGANYAAVDESPPNTTDYVAASSSDTGVRDLYTLQDLPSNALEVLAMRPNLYVGKSDVGFARIAPCVKQDGVVGTDAPLIVSSVGYSSLAGEVRTTRASDGTPLTVADLNNTQAGFEVAAS